MTKRQRAIRFASNVLYIELVYTKWLDVIEEALIIAKIRRLSDG